MRRDRVALLDPGVDANVLRDRRGHEMHEPAGRGKEARARVLGVDARLDRVAVDRELVLAQRELLAGGDPELPLDEIDAGDHLGHRMLDLEAGVHLHEVEGARRIRDELHGPGAGVADRLCGADGALAHRRAPLLRHAGRRRLLEDLLVTALDRAVALEEVHVVAVLIAEDLDLDVPRPLDVALDEDVIGAERARCLALARRERSCEVRRGVDAAHSLAAATRARLDQHRVADA